MTDRIDRFKARRQLQAQLRDQPVLVALPTPADALAMLQQPIDTQRVELVFSALSVDLDTQVSDAEVDAALLDFSKACNGERFDQLLRDSRREVLQAVAVPFGLGKALAAYDKVGGNVDTIHNAREQVYATEEARGSYTKVPKMDKALRKTFDGDKRYTDKNRVDTTSQAAGLLKDAYTDEVFGPKQVDKRNLDHTISASEIHRDPGRDLAGLDAIPLANSKSNLNPTQERFNQSKGDQKVEDLVNRLQKESPARRARIAELQSTPESELTVKERNELRLNLQKQTIADNPELILAKDKVARAEYEAKLHDAYYKSEKFKKDLFDTSVKEGGKMAFQQAFGLMLADSMTLGHSAHDHLDTRSMLTWTPDPRSLGQAVGAQRRRFALLV